MQTKVHLAYLFFTLTRVVTASLLHWLRSDLIVLIKLVSLKRIGAQAMEKM